MTGLRPGPPHRDLALLRRWGAERQAHSLASLLDHLVGTYGVLDRWGCRPALKRAGLFHSIYGTESFWGALRDLGQRDEVRRACGAECEEIVYLFSTMTRESFDASLAGGVRGIHDRHAGERRVLSPARHRDLCLLCAANWLEQVPRLDAPYLELGRERSRLLAAHLPPPARAELAAVYAAV